MCNRRVELLLWLILCASVRSQVASLIALARYHFATLFLCSLFQSLSLSFSLIISRTPDLVSRVCRGNVYDHSTRSLSTGRWSEFRKLDSGVELKCRWLWLNFMWNSANMQCLAAMNFYDHQRQCCAVLRCNSSSSVCTFTLPSRLDPHRPSDWLTDWL